jgi:hypothetical protein
MLTHCLKGLGQWQAEEDWQRAREIRARARAENRYMTPHEAREAEACDRRGSYNYIDSVFRDQIKQLRQDAERGPLNHYKIKTLKLLARDFAEARELLQACLPYCLKRKSLREIVKETPRMEGETNITWVHRIWDACEEYGTKCPSVITIELLEKLSQRG